MMIWLSLWMPACLAMGAAAQVSAPGSMACDCPFAGQPGGMAAACAHVDGLGTYLDAKSTPVDLHVFHAVPATPIEGSVPVRDPVTVSPPVDGPPPYSRRSLHLQYCVFLI